MDELLELIYQAASAPELWARVMEQVAQSINAATSTLLYHDLPDGISVGSAFGFSAAQAQSYTAHFKHVDFHYSDFRVLSPGGVLADDHNFDFDAFSESEIYQDFWRPADLGHGMAGVVFNDPAKSSIVSARRNVDRGPFTIAEIRIFQCLLPHLRRSLLFRDELAKAKFRADALAGALDQFPIAVILLDKACKVLDHNRAARELLADSNCPIKISAERLNAHRPADNRHLQEAVRSGVSSLRNAAPLPCFLRFLMRDGLRIMILMPVPFARSIADTVSDGIMLFCREASTTYLDTVKLQQRFGFTPAESRLAASLAEGSTLEGFATKRGISIGTARVQLKAAMAKADARTQAQLVGAILRSLAALVRGV